MDVSFGGPPVGPPPSQQPVGVHRVSGAALNHAAVYGLTATLHGRESLPSLQKKRQRVQELPCLRSLNKQVAGR